MGELKGGAMLAIRLAAWMETRLKRPVHGPARHVCLAANTRISATTRRQPHQTNISFGWWQVESAKPALLMTNLHLP